MSLCVWSGKAEQKSFIHFQEGGVFFRPIYMEKSCPGKKGHPPTLATLGTPTISLQAVVNHLHEKQIGGLGRRVTCLARSPLHWWGHPPSQAKVSRYKHPGVPSWVKLI